MSIVIFDIKDGAPTSYHLKQREVLAPNKEGQLKFIGYYRGQNSIFTEDIDNKDIKPSKVPDFVFNPTRNKCELRFDDRDSALLTYITTHPYHAIGKYELYSEDIENKRKLGKAELVEKALDFVKESDDLRIRALGLTVLGLSTYNQPTGTVKALLKDDAINKPKNIIDACESDLFENKFIASLALCSGVVKTNATKTAIVWADNQGRILSIATGEDFITKFAQHISRKSPESEALLQEIGNRLELTKKEKASQNAEASKIAELEAKLAQMQEDLEISQSREAKVEPTQEEKAEATLQELAIMEMRDKYTEVTGKNLSIRYQNDMEWMQTKMDEHLKEQGN